MEALAPAWARQEKLGRRVTTKIEHKDLVMTQHRPAQVYQIKARSNEEAKELERRMRELRKSFPDEVKVKKKCLRFLPFGSPPSPAPGATPRLEG